MTQTDRCSETEAEHRNRLDRQMIEGTAEADPLSHRGGALQTTEEKKRALTTDSEAHTDNQTRKEDRTTTEMRIAAEEVSRT